MRSTSLLLAAALMLSGCVSVPTISSETASPAESSPAREAMHATFRDTELAADYQQALTAMRAGNDELAKSRLEALTETEQPPAGPFINLGILLLKENDSQGAEAAFRKATEANSGNAVAHSQLGLALRQLGRFKEAEAAYQAALRTNPDYPLAHRNLGILYDLYLQQPGKALPHYRRYRELMAQPDDEVTRWIAELERRLKKGG